MIPRKARVLEGVSEETIREAGERQANLNELFRRGGSREPPYVRAPNSPIGFKPNPNADPISDLFLPQQTRIGSVQVPTEALHGAAGSVGALAIAAPTNAFLEDAKAELAAAEEAYDPDNPDAAAFQRLEAARNQVAILETFLRFELGVAAGSAGPVLHPGGIRPNLSRAERERTAIDHYLRVGRRPPPSSRPRTRRRK
jgi:hypothetical protein